MATRGRRGDLAGAGKTWFTGITRFCAPRERKPHRSPPVEPSSGEASIYEYRMAVRRIIDGDTLIADLDLGCYVTVTRRVRLAGINAPELNTEAGKAARAAAALWLSTSAPLTIRTTLDRDDKYGRLIGDISRADDVVTLSTWLVNAGHAVGYDGGKR